MDAFIKSLKENEIVFIEEEVEPIYEVTRILSENDEKSLTVFFKKIKNIALEAVGNVVNSREKLRRALNAKSDEEAYIKIIESMSNPLKHKEVSFNLKEYNKTVLTLPAVKFFEKDGGRYFTSSIVVACINGTCNASVHRIMILDEKRLVIRIVPRHLHYIYTENLREGRETPVAIIIGVHPAVLFASALSPPLGIFELDVAGRLLGRPLRLARTPIHEIPVPESSSIVIEGRITRELADEGPFVDLTKTYDRVRKQPIIRIDKIYISDSALAHIILPGGREHQLLMGYPREASVWDTVRRVVPKVHKVRLTPGGGGWLHAIISIDKNVDGDAKNAILAAFAGHPSLKHVIIVDSDIDPDNLVDVEWAIATRFQGSRDLIVIENARGSTLDPSSADGLTTKIGIDATAPLAEREKYQKAKIP